MKILIIAPTPFFADKGTSIRILEESLSLEKMGHSIIISTYHVGKNINKYSRIKVKRIPKILFWYKKTEAGPNWQKIILDCLLFFKTLYLVIIKNPQIIHAHLHEGVIIGWAIKKLIFWKNIKLIGDFHGSLTKEMISHNYLKNKILQKIFIKAELFINNIPNHAIASSRELSREIKKNRKIGNTTTILDGVNLKNYKIDKSKTKIRKKLNIPTDKIIIIYTGALITNKGIKYLLDAILIIKQKIENAFFVIAGSPSREIKQYIKKNNLENKIKLISPLNYFDLPEINISGDIGIDPKESNVGQASGKILQYMAAGLPVVCFNRPNNRSYLGKSGYYVQAISSQGIADGILYFLKNTEKIKKMGEIAKQRSKKFSWKNSAKKIENIYQN